MGVQVLIKRMLVGICILVFVSMLWELFLMVLLIMVFSKHLDLLSSSLLITSVLQSELLLSPNSIVFLTFLPMTLLVLEKMDLLINPLKLLVASVSFLILMSTDLLTLGKLLQLMFHLLHVKVVQLHLYFLVKTLIKMMIWITWPVVKELSRVDISPRKNLLLLI